MRNKSSVIAGVILSLTLLFIAYYCFYIRSMVILAYQGTAPDWFMNLISELYPRFFVEKYRFQPEFFLKKADQVVIRFSFISFLSCLILLLLQKKSQFKSAVEQYFNQTTSKINANTLRIFYFISILVLFYDIYWVLEDLELMKAFYKPIPLLKFFHIEFPSLLTILIVCIAIYTSCILGILSIFPVLNSIIVLLLFIYIQGLLFSFEKIDHGFAPITYAGMIMPFLLLEFNKNIKENISSIQSWPLQLIRLLICLCYFFAGIEKLFTAGLEWIHPDTFRTYLLIHHTKAGMWVASSNILCILLPAFALLFQLGFIAILFYKKLLPYFLITGIIFHIFIYFLFDVGGILHPWILSYFFFINWEKKIK